MFQLFQRHDGKVYQKLAGMLEIHRHPIPHHGLHLAYPPFAVMRVQNPHPRLDSMHRIVSNRFRCETSSHRSPKPRVSDLLFAE